MNAEEIQKDTFISDRTEKNTVKDINYKER